MATPSLRPRPQSIQATSLSVAKSLDTRDAQDALWNLNLLAALRSGDPSRIHPFLADLSKQVQQSKRPTLSRRPSTSTTPVSDNAKAGSSRLSIDTERSGLAVLNSTQERAGYILHLAVRVASCATISLILSHKQVSPNLYYPSAPSSSRTTPLHLAASLGREDVVRLLLEEDDIDDTLRDGQGRTVPEVASSPEIGKIIRDSLTSLEDKYHNILRTYISSQLSAPPPAELITLLRSPRSSQLDLMTLLNGTTLLHEAARRGNLDVIELAMARGADIFARDVRGRGVLDVVGRDTGIRAVLRQYTNQDPSLLDSTSSTPPPNLKGYLSKYANVAKGYSPRYFVLQDGVLSYYRTQADYPITCRGSIHMALATVKTSSSDKLRLEISLRSPSSPRRGGSISSNGMKDAVPSSPADLRWFLRGDHVGEVGRWAQALRRNAEYYGARMGGDVTPPRGNQEAGGPFLRKGYARSLSGVLKRKSVDSAGAFPSATLGVRTGSSTSVSVTGAQETVAMDSEDSEEAEADESGDGRGGLPFCDWEMAAESVKAQVEAMRSAISALVPPSTNNAASSALTESLTTLLSLTSTWRSQQRAREKWFQGELQREKQARTLWEESLAGVVGESEQMAEELRKERRKRKEAMGSLRSMHSLAALPLPNGVDEDGVLIAGVEGLPSVSESAVSTAVPPLDTEILDTTDREKEFESPESEESDDEFFDAVDAGLLPLTVPSPIVHPVSNPPFRLLDPEVYVAYTNLRTRLPVDADQRPPVSLWAVLKNSIGKDLTRISFPVFFNEPTSMLQRMAEDMEFSECLDAAVQDPDPHKRIAFVAAFAMSNYSSTIGRIAKPFNPMLSETFEYCRFDKQYRYVSEQVSHHPPISACYCEAPEWLYYGEVDAKNKFMGKSFEIRPTGAAFADLKLTADKLENTAGYPREVKGGVERFVEHYSWKKVTTSVSGFIFGRPTIDHYGDMTVTNHRTGDKCILTFKPRGWRGTDACEIKGKVISASGETTWLIAGRWSTQLVMRRAESASEFSPDVSIDGPASPSSITPEYMLLWRNTPKPPAPFNLTPFALTLNDLPEDPNLLRKYLPPTDCRLRPDQRAFEQGRYEEANGLKSAQEEFQRAAKRARERGEKPPHVPRWFRPEEDEDSGERVWRPSRLDGEVEYWLERERVGKQGAAWREVDTIFIDV